MYLKTLFAGLIMFLMTASVMGQPAQQSSHQQGMKKGRMNMTMDTTGKTGDTLTAKTLAPQTTCPVTGTPIDKKLFVDYKGKRIYVCCSDCIDSVAKNPEKYIRKLEASGQAVEVIGAVKTSPKKTLAPQTTCPVMGGAIDKKYFVDYKGKRIYVCCPGCIDELKSDPEKYIKKLESMGQSVETIARETKGKK